MVNNKPKILFVHEGFGKLSEVFLHRINISLQNFDVSLMAGEYINHEFFPFDQKKVYIWTYKDVQLYQKIIPYINRKINAKGRQSGLYEVIISQINKSDVDLVCFQFANIAVKMGKDIGKIKKKMCLIHHGTDLNIAVENKEYRLRLKEVWKKVDKIIFVSHFLKDVGVSLGCPESKAIVNYLGVPDISENHKKTINDDIFRFISVARMVPVKNHINLVRAFSELLKHTSKKVELILIGTGELENEVRNEVFSLGLENQVRLLGGLSNDKVLPHIANADAFVLISKVYMLKAKMRQEEALGLVLLEAAKFSLPLIGSTTGGIPEVVKDGINGYLVNPLDIHEISSAMLKMIEDPIKTQQMGKKAKELVEEQFSMEQQIKKLEKIFLDILIAK